MTTYTLRGKCLTEVGDDKGWHYCYVDQETTVNESITCPAHSEATIQDVVIDHEVET